MTSISGADELKHICNDLARRDPDLRVIIDTFGYPPFWSRPNTYETMVHLILEQQVSLASALAALEKLRVRVGRITPENVARLSDDELRDVYVSRQKAGYLKNLAQVIMRGDLRLAELETMPDNTIRDRLIQHKGIGNWTIDVYLIMVLHRADIFPIGDIAAVNTLKKLKNLSKEAPSEQVLNTARSWAPHQTVATMLLWHYYIESRRPKAMARASF